MAADVISSPELLKELDVGLETNDPVISMRAADAMEKVSVIHPEYLQSYQDHLIQLANKLERKEVRWHMAQILPRLNLNHEENILVVKILTSYLSGNSSIVNIFVMQAFFDIAQTDQALEAGLMQHIKELANNGTAAMKARGRKLLSSKKSLP